MVVSRGRITWRSARARRRIERSRPALRAAASAWIARNVDGPVPARALQLADPFASRAAIEREAPSGPRWMLLGDAAGWSIRSRAKASSSRSVSGERGGRQSARTGDPAAAYAEAVRDTVYDELTRAARLKARFFSPRFTRSLVRGA